jgi:hypothetical protein
MKAIASSIIIAAGIYGIVHANGAGNFVFAALAFAASLAVTALGIIGWWACLKHEK